MENLLVSSTFEELTKNLNLDMTMQKIAKRVNNGLQKKADLTFIYKKGSSTCIKISKEVGDKIGICDYVGISYFPDEKMFMLSRNYSTLGTLYPVCFNKSDKKYRCYRIELFKALVEAAGITFDNCTCVSYRNTEIKDHPQLGKIALVYMNES